MKTPATPAPVLVEEEFVEVRKALSGIARMSWRIAPTQWQPRFGRDKVLKSLLGSKDEKIIGAGLDKLSTYGILKPHGKAFANALLKEMEIVGLVEVTQGDYPLLGLTETGARAMLEGGDVFMRYPGELSKLAKKKLKQRVIANANAFHAAQTNGTLTDDTPGKQTKEPPPDYDEELYKKLCSKRNQLRFLRGNVPAYQIFPNAVLQQLAARKPASAQDAMDIKGIGPAKAKSFLPSFLKIIAAHAGS